MLQDDLNLSAIYLSGLIIRFIGRWQARDFRKGATILKLAANVMKVTGIVGESKTGSIDEVTCWTKYPTLVVAKQ